MKLTNHLNSRGYRGIRLEIDFGDVLRNADLEVISGLEKYSQKFGEIVPVSHLCALDIGSVDQEILERLMGFHDRMFISVGEGSMVSLSHSSPQEEPIIPSIDIMSQDTMERCVKSSLDVIVLSLLQQEPMCGFDVIKTIVQRFNVLLSQGVVYPLLYSLKEQGYLTVEVKPDHKTRVYVPTEIGREFIKEKLMEYSAAQKRILDLTASSICEEK
jgi:DNA-binding PadR family transcriptional regulator